MSDRSAGPSGSGSKPPWRPFNPYWKKKQSAMPQAKPTVILLPATPFTISGADPTPGTSRDILTAPLPSMPTYDAFFLHKLFPNEAYPTWKLYFANEKYTPDSPIVKQIKIFESHFKRHSALYDLVKIYSTFYFDLDLKFIQDDETFVSAWSSFHEDLIDSPQQILSAAGLAIHQMSFKCSEIQEEINSIEIIVRKRSAFRIFRARLLNLTPIDDIAAVRHKKYETLISIRATVVTIGESALISSWTAYECLLCNAKQIVKQEAGVVTEPSTCQQDGCTNRSKFKPQLDSPYNRLEQFQTIRIQQLLTTGKYEDETKQIKSIEVDVLNQYVDMVKPGEDILVHGIIKIRPEEDFGSRKNEGLKLYLEAISIANESSCYNFSSFTEKDLEAVQMIKNEPSPFRLLVQSLCPSIFGHEMVKAGLVLALVGGCGNDYGLRPDIHVIMVGDPGIGKSEMLKACSKISPKEVFTSGCGSTIAGLTVTVKSRKNGGEVEAGALVLADKAHCCIDEFDKVRSNQQAVLEVMEQQTIAVAKAGVYCSIPARTSVIAAANPDSGSYNRSKTVLENLKMDEALLSRFDLIFIMIDKPNHHFDEMMTKHVQAYYSGAKKDPKNDSIDSWNRSINTSSVSDNNDDGDLETRLRLKPDEDMDLLPRILMQRYIVYARKNCKPRIAMEAGKALQAFYVELRQATANSGLIPTTVRQFEGLLRLTQARARVDLCDEATLAHAMEVIEIFRYGMVDVFTVGPQSPIDVMAGRSSAGSSRKGQATQVKQFLELLQKASRTSDKQTFEVAELKEIASWKGLEDNITYLIDTLNNQGYLLKKSANLFRFVPG